MDLASYHENDLFSGLVLCFIMVCIAIGIFIFVLDKLSQPKDSNTFSPTSSEYRYHGPGTGLRLPKVSVEGQRESTWSFSMNPFSKRHESNEAVNPRLHQAFMSPLMIALPASSTHTQDMFDQLRTAAELELIEITAFIPEKV